MSLYQNTNNICTLYLMTLYKMDKVKLLVLILIICLVIILVVKYDQQNKLAEVKVADGGRLDEREYNLPPQPPIVADVNGKVIDVNGKVIDVTGKVIDANGKVVDGGKAPKQTIIIDGLNYIHQYLKHDKIDDQNMLVSYPNIVNVWKGINVAAREYEAKKNNIIFVLKNQDGYKLSEPEKKLYEVLAKRLKLSIHIAYDPQLRSVKPEEHYLLGRDDKYINQLKANDPNAEIITKDKYKDAVDFDKVPPFEVLKFS